jgi:hypothetical protein
VNQNNTVIKKTFNVGGVTLLMITGDTKDVLNLVKSTLADPARSTLALLGNTKDDQVSVLATQVGDDEVVEGADQAIRKINMNAPEIQQFFGQDGFTPVYGLSNLGDEGAWLATGKGFNAGDTAVDAMIATKIYDTYLQNTDLNEVVFYGPTGPREEFVWALTSDDTFKQIDAPFGDDTDVRHTVANGQLIVAVVDGGTELKFATSNQLMAIAWGDNTSDGAPANTAYGQKLDVGTSVRDLSIGEQIAKDPVARYRLIVTTQSGILPVELSFDGNELIAAQQPGEAVTVDELNLGSTIRNNGDNTVFFGQGEVNFVPKTKFTNRYNELLGNQPAQAK